MSEKSTGNIAYTNPIIDYGADPSVYYYDGWYYYVCPTVQNGYSAIQINRAANVCDIGNTVSHVIYSFTDAGIASIWAPQIYMFDGVWYVYFSGALAENASVKRTPYVLKSDSDDPFGTYTMVGKMQNLDTHNTNKVNKRFIAEPKKYIALVMRYTSCAT
ncbi:MAG: family 43 glycosylhydrolase [Akkermansia sp.]|nr:family 43 glycosylhydrolase [Akkermansia sp.]